MSCRKCYVARCPSLIRREWQHKLRGRSLLPIQRFQKERGRWISSFTDETVRSGSRIVNFSRNKTHVGDSPYAIQDGKMMCFVEPHVEVTPMKALGDVKQVFQNRTRLFRLQTLGTTSFWRSQSCF